MSVIGSLVFCTGCGNLLPASKGDEKNVLTCEACGEQNKDTVFKEIVTQTKPSDFPSLLRQKLSTVQTVERHKIRTEAATNTETCEKCGGTDITFAAVQLRSADEGSTIFYTCKKCGNKYATMRRVRSLRMIADMKTGGRKTTNTTQLQLLALNVPSLPINSTTAMRAIDMSSSSVY
ncbi:hypothetical protein PG991_002831 [Apiospora marii]|uniref:DNA-directed RNA polymerase I subunit RPA12 n=1 Tax=Apiospora marii TaxID=335849 RepID=A0ABR1SGG7_9PEZI